jgi:MFS family permease
LIETPKFFYGWVNVFFAFMSITTYGLFYSYGVFLETLEATLQSTRAAMSAAYTIELAVYCTCAIPWGWFTDKYGPRKSLWVAALLIGCGISLCSLATSVWHLYLFFGVIAAIGHGAVWVAPTSTLSRWFIRRRGLAIGIAMCGLGFGLLIVPPATAQVINLYGWKAALIALGVIFFTVNMLAGIFMRRRPEDMGLRPLGESDKTHNSMHTSSVGTNDFSIMETLGTNAFWLLYLIFLLCFAAEQMVLVHIVPYGRTVGISIAQGALGLSFLGAGTVVGRVSIGALSDKIGRVPALIMCCCIEAGSIFCVLAIKGPLMLYVTMILLGFVYGGTAVLCVAALGDFFGLKDIGMIMGVWATSGVPAGVLGPLMGGIVFDVSKSYFWAIIIAGILCIGAVIASASIKPPQKGPRLQLECA